LALKEVALPVLRPLVDLDLLEPVESLFLLFLFLVVLAVRAFEDDRVADFDRVEGLTALREPDFDEDRDERLRDLFFSLDPLLEGERWREPLLVLDLLLEAARDELLEAEREALLDLDRVLEGELVRDPPYFSDRPRVLVERF
jgi:hypothetical protein